MCVLEGLQPASVFYFFEEICGIPHISFHEKALSDYCVKFAEERGLFCQQDSLGNVVIIADATPGYEQEDAVILQGHLDMVGDKTPDCPIDMEKESIQIMVDGDYICAKDTTLGGDDGIAVAYALALLDAKDIPHPRLEVVLTVSEEVGLLGASAVDLSMCQGRRLINVDSEVEGVLTVGCAGGLRAKVDIPMARQMMTGAVCEVRLDGLKGGHSGMEIDKGRANANILLGRFLLLLKEETEYGLIHIQGGVKENVIPKDGSAKLLIAPEKTAVLQKVIHTFREEIAAEYGTADPAIQLHLSVGEVQTADVLDPSSLDRALTAFHTMPNGIQAMSMDLPGLVETSLNMGAAELTEEQLQFLFSVRSSVASAKGYTVKKIQLLAAMLGGTVQISGEYPAWPYARNSELRDLCIEIFRNQYGREPKVELIHAGLECGILSDKMEGLDCISIGPDMKDIHSPKERLSISSVARVWEYLKAVLAVKKA